jgi:hypothetical protein
MVTTTNSLPLTLMRSGASMIGLGVAFGFLIPLTTYPRLGASAHVHALMEGMMITCAGILLQHAPFPPRGRARSLADTLSGWQTKLIYWAFAFSWPLLLSEAFNGWWGTRTTLPTAAEAANVQRAAPVWQEFVVAITHFPSAFPQLFVVS